MPDCPYCQRPAELVTGREVYPNRADLAERRFYRCVPCDARVGTHAEVRHGIDRNGQPYEMWEPLGTLANAALRSLRQEVHRWLDPIYQTTRPGLSTSRTAAYRWLSRQLGVDRFHTAMADEALCRRAIAVLQTHSFHNPPVPGPGLLSPQQAERFVSDLLRRPVLFDQLQETSYNEPAQAQASVRVNARPQPQPSAGEEPRQADGGILGPRKRLWPGAW